MQPVSTSTLAPAPPRDADEERLHEATLKSITPQADQRLRRGVFDAVLQGADGPIRAIAEPALTTAPTAYRASYACYRLARALGMRVVPPTTVRGVPLAELGAAAGAAREARALLGRLRVQNDGAVDVLFAGSSSAGTPLDPFEGPEATSWDRWSREPVPAPGEDTDLLRDYLEMLALDYLAGNGVRQLATRSGPHSLTLADNRGAFPAHMDPRLLDRLLRRLRAAARFPRGLRDALARLDPPTARRTFNGGAFEEWLLSPRTLVELGERRAALLSLIEARVAERGADAVLAL